MPKQKHREDRRRTVRLYVLRARLDSPVHACLTTKFWTLGASERNNVIKDIAPDSFASETRQTRDRFVARTIAIVNRDGATLFIFLLRKKRKPTGLSPGEIESMEIIRHRRNVPINEIYRGDPPQLRYLGGNG